MFLEGDCTVNDKQRRSCDNRGMREIKHSALVAQPPAKLFDLINDIENYPSFIPWCTHAKVLSKSERQLVATIGVKQGPLQSEFTTRNDLERPRLIQMHLIAGPFKMLEGEWLLIPIAQTASKASVGVAGGGGGNPSPVSGDSGCRVQLTMKFAFKNPLTAVLFEQKFAETTASLLDAFVARARSLPP